MAIKFNRSQTFATNGTVTAAGLHNLVDGLDIYQALITDQTNLTSVGTADELLIADADLTAADAPRSVTVQELFNDALTVGTYTDANFTANLTYGTATGNRTVSTNASITTGTINNATLGTTTGTAATFTNATATGANITNGTIQTLTSSTATITGGTFSGLLNSSTGTFSGAINSTTGTIGNFSTTLSGDFTISQGTGTLGTTGVSAGTYGSSGLISSITVDAKGRITSIGTAIGGKVLQVVESTYSTTVVVSSTSYTDTGLSCSITPTYSSSKILVLAQQNSYAVRSSSFIGGALKVVRTIGTTSTDIYSQQTGAVDLFITNAGSTSIGILTNLFVECVDSPNTTLQSTYKIQGAATTTANSGRIEFQNGSAISKLVLIEVAA